MASNDDFDPFTEEGSLDTLQLAVVLLRHTCRSPADIPVHVE